MPPCRPQAVGSGASGAFISEGHAAVAVVDDMPVVKHRRVLVDGRKARIGQACQHGGMDRMDMHDASRMGAGTMNAAVQAPGRGVRRIGAGHGVRIVGVDLDQRGRRDPAEVPSVRVDEKPGTFRVHRQREVIPHRLVHVKPSGPAEGSCEVLPHIQECHVGVTIHTESLLRIRHQPIQGLLFGSE